MTPRTNARLAGTAYLAYFAFGIGDMIVSGKTTAGAVGTAAQLASIAQHESLMGIRIILALLQAVCAVVLGVTLYALTRDQDRDLAMLGMACRVVEGASNALSITRTLSLLSVATMSVAAAGGPDAAATQALGRLMLRGGGGAGGAGAFLFGLGSLCFCICLVRSRGIPAWLAWLGLLSSALWVIGMPLQLGGFLGGPATYAMWIPMGVFELIFAVWLISVGVNPRPARPLALAQA